MEAQSAPSSSTDPREPVVLELRASKQGRLHGKAWKSDKVATRRSYISSELKTPFEKRMEKSKAHKALLAVEQEMKESEQEAKDRCVGCLDAGGLRLRADPPVR